MLHDTLSILKWYNIYPRAQSGFLDISVIRSYDSGVVVTVVMSSFNCMYGLGKGKGIGNRMFRNVNSFSQLTRIICILSGSDSCPEWYSELPCDDSSSDSYSEVFDMASIQGSGTWTGVSCSFVPPNFCSG